MTRRPDRSVQLAVVENLFAAQRLAALLAEHDIPCQIQSFADGAYAGLFQSTRGWGELRVAAEDLEAARALVSDSGPVEIAAEELDREAAAAASSEPPAAESGRRAALRLGLVLALLAAGLAFGVWRSFLEEGEAGRAELTLVQLIDVTGDERPELLLHRGRLDEPARLAVQRLEGGETLWARELPLRHELAPLRVVRRADLLVAAGLHVASAQRAVVGLEAGTGAQRWLWLDPGTQAPRAVQVVGGQIVVSFRDHDPVQDAWTTRLVVLDAATGKPIRGMRRETSAWRTTVVPPSGVCVEMLGGERIEEFVYDVATGERRPGGCPACVSEWPHEPADHDVLWGPHDLAALDVWDRAAAARSQRFTIRLLVPNCTSHRETSLVVFDEKAQQVVWTSAPVKDPRLERAGAFPSAEGTLLTLRAYTRPPPFGTRWVLVALDGATGRFRPLPELRGGEQGPSRLEVDSRVGRWLAGRLQGRVWVVDLQGPTVLRDDAGALAFGDGRAWAERLFGAMPWAE